MCERNETFRFKRNIKKMYKVENEFMHRSICKRIKKTTNHDEMNERINAEFRSTCPVAYGENQKIKLCEVKKNLFPSGKHINKEFSGEKSDKIVCEKI